MAIYLLREGSGVSSPLLGEAKILSVEHLSSRKGIKTTLRCFKALEVG